MPDDRPTAAEVVALIARLEAATEGSEELDLEIGRAIWSGLIADNKRLDGSLPCFSRSVDAALGLRESQWGITIDLLPGSADVCITIFGNGFLSDKGDAEYFGQAPTAPLAILTAILRARQGCGG